MRRVFCVIVALLLGVVSPARADSLLVTDISTHSVLAFEVGTDRFLGTFASGQDLLGPTGLTLGGPDNNLYVTNVRSDLYSDVLQFDGHSGAFIKTLVPRNPDPSLGFDYWFQLTFGSPKNLTDKNLYVAGGYSRFIHRYNGTTGASLGDFSSHSPSSVPVGVTMGPDGYLYVSIDGGGASPPPFPNGVNRFDPVTGTFIDQFVADNAGGLAGAFGLKFGPDGNLYVCSEATNQILRYDGPNSATPGAFKDIFASQGLSEPLGLVFGPNGDLYVANAGGSGNGSIVHFDPNGNFLSSFSSPGSAAYYDVIYLDYNVVPEPASAMLLGTGVLGILGYTWRRRRMPGTSR
jgi:WD40 repeat protein